MSPDRSAALGITLMVMGLILLLALAWRQGDAFYPAYLGAYAFWLGLSLGPLALHMIGRVTGGRWTRVNQGVFLAASGVLPLLALLFVPVVIGLPQLYVWFPDAAIHAEPVAHKAPFLNSGFFVVRAVVYFAIWIALAHFLMRSAERGQAAAARRLGALGLVLYALTGSFAMIDWIMSLLPEWYSTVFAVQILAAYLLQGTCLAGLVLAARTGVSVQDRHDLGNLMLVFTLLWAYLAFSDYLTIWIADLPHETLWYRLRNDGLWQWVGAGLILAMFAVPFLALLFRSLKRSRVGLAAVAALVLFASLVYSLWLVLPSVQPPRQAGLTGSVLGASVALGALWLGMFQLRLQRQRTRLSHEAGDG